MAISRSTAYRVKIAEIVNGEFIKQEGFNPSYIIIRSNNVSRINIIATVVGKYIAEDENYAAITIDDGSETIRIKGFGPDVIKLKGAKVSELVRVVGKIKKYNEEMYLIGEVITKLDDPNWLIVDQLELKSIKTEIVPVSNNTEEKVSETESEVIKIEAENPNMNILSLIKNEDKGEGALLENIIKNSGLDDEGAKNAIFNLLKTGEIFEPKKGILKILD